MVFGNKIEDIVKGIESGKDLYIARAISYIENDFKLGYDILSSIIDNIADSVIIGITGPPGAGKSSLINKLIPIVSKDYNLGILAIDPTSPFTKGSLLGDRLRMNKTISKFSNVYMRSMASKSSRGGISPCTLDACLILSAAGKNVIFVETVGVGQVELDIAEISDIVVVILVPNSGDGIQAMKAGLMEIADIFVVNKFDLDGANSFLTELNMVLEMKSYYSNRANPPIFPTISTTNKGIFELFKELDNRINLILNKDFKSRKKQRIVKWLFSRLLNNYYNLLDNKDFLLKAYDLAERVINKDIDLKQANLSFLKLFTGG